MHQDEINQWQKLFKSFVIIQIQQDIAHIERVVSYALAFTKKEKADINIVLPASWLHDCVNVTKTSPLGAKASLISADRAIKYLKEIGYPETI